MSMRCEILGCPSEAGAPSMHRLEDDLTRVAVSLCSDHKKHLDAGEIRINRRTAQGRFELLPGPTLVHR
jgi:hypothetical protein